MRALAGAARARGTGGEGLRGVEDLRGREPHRFFGRDRWARARRPALAKGAAWGSSFEAGRAHHGASSGIGAAAARANSGAGAKVVLAARQLAREESLAQELVRLGREAMAVPCDVRDEGQVSEAVSASALRFGGLDVLVSNAGVGLYGRVEEKS
jgi:hypothetical protein